MAGSLRQRDSQTARGPSAPISTAYVDSLAIDAFERGGLSDSGTSVSATRATNTCTMDTAMIGAR